MDDCVGGAEPLSQPRRQLGEEDVTGGVTPRLVDAAEAVQVDGDDGGDAPVTFPAGEGGAHPIEEEPSSLGARTLVWERGIVHDHG